MSSKKKSPDIKVQAASKPPEVRRRPDLAVYYVNNTGIIGTPWDISLLLGRIVDIEDGKPIVDQFAQVYMTPAHAKAVNVLLTKQIDAYERSHGLIPTTGYTVGSAPSKPPSGA